MPRRMSVTAVTSTHSEATKQKPPRDQTSGGGVLNKKPLKPAGER